MKHASILPAWSIASPDDIELTARELVRVRDRFLSSDEFARGVTPRPLIKRSWERCRAARVDSTRRCAPLAITRDAQLDELLATNEPLLRAGRPAVERLAEHLAGSGYVVVIADPKGSILEVMGDQNVRRRLAQIDFVPGGDWSELSAGTNAIGTALAARHAVQLMGAEHFCDGWTDLTCTAAPIRHPITGEVIGILDVTGNYRLIRSHLTSLLAATALDIEEQLRVFFEPHAGSRAAGPLANEVHTQAHDATETNSGYSDSVLLTIAGGAVTASLDVMQTLRSVAEQTATLVHTDSTSVCLFAERDDDARFSRVWTSRSSDIPRAALGHLLANCDAVAQLQERGEPIIVDDVASEPLFESIDVPLVIRSIALFPLATPRGIIGFVAAARPSISHWSSVDLRRIFALISQASTAIENALLFESLRQQFRHMKALNAISQILGEVLDPSEHLPSLVGSIVRVMDCATGSLWISRGSNRRFIRAFCDDGNDETPSELSTQVHESGLARLQRALSADTLGVPLLDESGTFGVLELQGRRKRAFETVDIETITAIAQQLAMSLKNAELQRTARELEVLRRSDRLKSEFLATVSHDLRSPLTAIRASVDGLLDRPFQHRVNASDGFLHTISNQVNRLTRLVDQLLDVSQIEAGGLRLDREWNELHALLAYAVADVGALHVGHRIAYRPPVDAPLLFVDHDRFIQVLYNLLDNACKHGYGSQTVTIETTWTSRMVTIVVADMGPGVQPCDYHRIFKRFHRGEESRKGARGSGLGLAICRGIVEAHGGSIWVEQRPGGGARFCFDVPLVTNLETESTP